MVNRDGDRQLLGVMVSHGADLSKPAHTIHYLYFPSRGAADAAAAELRAAGYEGVYVDRAATASLWQRWFGPKLFTCIAETHAVPSEQAVFATSDRMNALAKRLGGDYDGWEASVEK